LKPEIYQSGDAGRSAKRGQEETFYSSDSFTEAVRRCVLRSLHVAYIFFSSPLRVVIPQLTSPLATRHEREICSYTQMFVMRGNRTRSLLRSRRVFRALHQSVVKLRIHIAYLFRSHQVTQFYKLKWKTKAGIMKRVVTVLRLPLK
jgi:hypothetical protein